MKTRIISSVLLLVFVAILTLAGCRTQVFVRRNGEKNFPETTDSIRVHFIHGSKRKKEFPDEHVRIGGMWGGHVEVQIDSLVIGFQQIKSPVHVFPRRRNRHFNSEVTIKQYKAWAVESRDDKITSISIPVDCKQKAQLLETYRRQHQQPPHDYAVLGFRCTSFALKSLGACDIFEHAGKAECLITAPYPARFRNSLLKIAQRKGWKTSLREGTTRKTWE